MDKDPSMEDILASIRRIINEDQPVAGVKPDAFAAPPPPAHEEVLDLVDPMPDMRTRIAEPPDAPRPALGAVQISGYAGADTTLEALVRSMLTPMLRDWLDTNLPGIVEQAVRSEVTRITRKDERD